jgi:hypothetical protein
MTGEPTKPGSAPGEAAAAARRILGEFATKQPKEKAVTAAHIEANGGGKTSAQPLDRTANQAAAHGLAPRVQSPPAHNPGESSVRPPRKPGGKGRRPLATKRISKRSTISGILTVGPTI